MTAGSSSIEKLFNHPIYSAGTIFFDLYLTEKDGQSRVRLYFILGGSMFRFGIWELLIILFIVLLLFGAGRLPEIARAMGRSIKEFKKGTREIRDEIESTLKDDDVKK